MKINITNIMDGVKDFVKEHKKAIIITTGVVVAGAIASGVGVGIANSDKDKVDGVDTTINEETTVVDETTGAEDTTVVEDTTAEETTGEETTVPESETEVTEPDTTVTPDTTVPETEAATKAPETDTQAPVVETLPETTVVPETTIPETTYPLEVKPAETFVSGNMTEEEIKEVQQHLASCRNCGNPKDEYHHRYTIEKACEHCGEIVPAYECHYCGDDE